MIEVQILTPAEWKEFSEYAHKICFNEVKPSSFDRIDFAMLCVGNGRPCAYVTCRELDPDTVYWQFGGAFPETRGTLLSWKCYEKMNEMIRGKYKRITTLIENNNIVMLKFAMKMGYRIIGVRNFKGSILLEHLLEFDKE